MNNECEQASSVRQRFQASGTGLERKREVKKSPACRATLIAGLVLAALTGDPGQAYSQGHDSLLNGALIGGAVGAASGVAFTYAVRDSDLGVNPATSGDVVRVPMPALTEERRKELAKLVKHEGENAKVAVRNIRRDAMNHVKALLKEGEVSEDDDKRAEKEIQQLTDKSIGDIDKIVADKEKELLAV